MSERTSGQADRWAATPVAMAVVPGAWSGGLSIRQPAGPPARLDCNRCGFLVISRAWGCKNPCPNCGTVYPLGDCSD